MKLFPLSSTRRLLAAIVLVWFMFTNSAMALQCGTFEQIPGPHPNTADDTLSHLAALSDGTAWALGTQLGETVLLYFNGSSWTAQALPAEVEGIAFADSTSTPDGDVWLTGTRAFSVYEVEVIFLRARNGVIDRIDHFFSPRAPIDLSGTSATDVWALTSAGDVIHFNGSDWTEMDVPSPFQRLYPRGVYAAGPDDAWAVGYGGDGRGTYIGYAQHWDGASWTTISTPFDGLRNHFFRGIDGSASDDVWIVGYINYNQTIAMHWDGSSWTQYPGPLSDAPFLDVSVLAPDDAWATPYSLNDIDVLYHWNGVAWGETVPLAAPEGSTVRWGGLAKAGPCDLWTTGSYYLEPSNHTLVARQMPGAGAFVFVQEVMVERVFDDPNSYARSRVVLATEDGQVASGVRVIGTFSGPTSEAVSGTTDDQGAVLLSSPSTDAATGVWCFDVTQLTRAGWLYDPALNVVSGGCEDVGAAVFVSDITVRKVRVARRMFQGQAVVTITDTDQGPVAGAEVTGTFSGPTSETLTMTTGVDGTATFMSAVVGRSRDQWCFMVDSVDADSAVYDPALNSETSDCAGN